jgi:hypothetical protein
MSFGSTAEKLLGHGHGHDHDHDHDHDHGDDRLLHPTGDGFVAPKAMHHGWLDPDPSPWRGIREPADEADEGLSTLGRRSTSRSRAAHEMNEGRRAAPAVLLSSIIYGLRRLSAKR